MNSIDRWCRRLSVVCCLILGIEALMFGHNAATQVRLLESPSLAKIDKPRSGLPPERHHFDFFSPKVAVN